MTYIVTISDGDSIIKVVCEDKNIAVVFAGQSLFGFLLGSDQFPNITVKDMREFIKDNLINLTLTNKVSFQGINVELSIGELT